MIRRAAAVLVAAAFATSACGGDDATDTAAPTPASTSVSTELSSDVSTQAAPEAFRITAPLVGGGEIDLAGYAAQPVLLWFWAPY